jgi:peptidyl-prolyl cis-trans isomerase A (cyclophilin A)
MTTGATAEEVAKLANPTVVLDTSEGKIKLVLFQDKAPISVQNFLDYAKSGHYDGTIFHRVIAGFMIQGGGFSQTWQKKPTKAPIKNEAKNGLYNKPGTVAMARTGVVDSATSQFFINLADNHPLDHSARDYGYAVFGEVLEGMDVVFAIGSARTGTKNGRRDVPVRDVVIKGVIILP